MHRREGAESAGDVDDRGRRRRRAARAGTRASSGRSRRRWCRRSRECRRAGDVRGRHTRADDARVVDQHVESAFGLRPSRPPRRPSRRRSRRAARSGRRAARRLHGRGLSSRAPIQTVWPASISRRAVSYPRLLLPPVMSVVVMVRACAESAARRLARRSVGPAVPGSVGHRRATMGVMDDAHGDLGPLLKSWRERRSPVDVGLPLAGTPPSRRPAPRGARRTRRALASTTSCGSSRAAPATPPIRSPHRWPGRCSSTTPSATTSSGSRGLLPPSERDGAAAHPTERAASRRAARRVPRSRSSRHPGICSPGVRSGRRCSATPPNAPAWIATSLCGRSASPHGRTARALACATRRR